VTLNTIFTLSVSHKSTKISFFIPGHKFSPLYLTHAHYHTDPMLNTQTTGVKYTDPMFNTQTTGVIYTDPMFNTQTTGVIYTDPMFNTQTTGVIYTDHWC